MADAIICIDQAAKPPCNPGESREDLDLFSGANPVTLSNDDDVGVVSWAWTLIDKPNGSTAVLSTPTASTSSFQADTEGSYLIRLVTVDGSGLTHRQERIAAVDLSNGWRLPAAFETLQFNIGGDPQRGWAQEMEEILRDIASGGPLVITLQDAYDDGSAIVTTAADGAVSLTRGATAAAANSLLTLADADAATGRTGHLVNVSDTNVVGAGPPDTVRISRTAAGLALNVIGDASVDGKLTVTGIIDPTGLDLTEQAAVPGGAPAAGHGKVWVRNDAPNVLIFTDDNGTDNELAYGVGATDLQEAYDAGAAIITDASGAVIFTRGAATPDGTSLFTLTDADVNPGRTVALVDISDTNTVAGDPGTLRVLRSATGATAIFESNSAGATGAEVVLYQ